MRRTMPRDVRRGLRVPTNGGRSCVRVRGPLPSRRVVRPRRRLRSSVPRSVPGRRELQRRQGVRVRAVLPAWSVVRSTQRLRRNVPRLVPLRSRMRHTKSMLALRASLRAGRRLRGARRVRRTVRRRLPGGLDVRRRARVPRAARRMQSRVRLPDGLAVRRRPMRRAVPAGKGVLQRGPLLRRERAVRVGHVRSTADVGRRPRAVSALDIVCVDRPSNSAGASGEPRRSLGFFADKTSTTEARPRCRAPSRGASTSLARRADRSPRSLARSAAWTGKYARLCSSSRVSYRKPPSVELRRTRDTRARAGRHGVGRCPHPRSVHSAR